MSKDKAKGRPGRRAVDGSEDLERATITLTEADRLKLARLGGSPWVRKKIREESDRTEVGQVTVKNGA